MENGREGWECEVNKVAWEGHIGGRWGREKGQREKGREGGWKEDRERKKILLQALVPPRPDPGDSIWMRPHFPAHLPPLVFMAD